MSRIVSVALHLGVQHTSARGSEIRIDVRTADGREHHRLMNMPSDDFTPLFDDLMRIAIEDLKRMAALPEAGGNSDSS